MHKRLSRKTPASLKLELDKAVTQMETINQALFELNPDDDEPEIVHYLKITRRAHHVRPNQM